MSSISAMKEKLADMRLREGLVYGRVEIENMERRIERAEKSLEPEAFVQLARERLEADYGEFPSEAIDKAAKAVSAQWQAEGREVRLTHDDAEALASQVGNKLFNGGQSFDPTRATTKEPTGLFGQAITEAQDKL